MSISSSNRAKNDVKSFSFMNSAECIKHGHSRKAEVQTPFVKQRAALAASTVWAGALLWFSQSASVPHPGRFIRLCLVFNGSKWLAGEFVQVSDNPGQHTKHPDPIRTNEFRLRIRVRSQINDDILATI
jgi:hypothetical protein